MKRSVIWFAALAIILFGIGSARAQTHFTMGFTLPEGTACGGEISGAPGEKRQIDVIGTITQSDFVAGKGAAGWSVGFRGENLEFVKDTAASGASCGTGEVIIPVPEFFCSIGLIDPTKDPESGPLHGKGPQGQGVVDGLALVIGKSFQGNGTFNIIKVKAELTFPNEGSTPVKLQWIDGLQGLGQPVKNGITSGGKTVDVNSDPALGKLTLGECTLTLKVAEAKQKPGDMSQDGKLDLDDAVQLLEYMFRGEHTLPCAGDIYSAANRALLDANGDGEVDVSDVAYNLRTQFLAGPPHVGGVACKAIAGCPGIPTCQ
ncbi:MAG: hypothetical protein HY717_05370 [Planctomycetes bacterium]|nr:hypothetical protein [Planctomycetota bacterium]